MVGLLITLDNIPINVRNATTSLSRGCDDDNNDRPLILRSNSLNASADDDNDASLDVYLVSVDVGVIGAPGSISVSIDGGISDTISIMPPSSASFISALPLRDRPCVDNDDDSEEDEDGATLGASRLDSFKHCSTNHSMECAPLSVLTMASTLAMDKLGHISHNRIIRSSIDCIDGNDDAAGAGGADGVGNDAMVDTNDVPSNESARLHRPNNTPLVSVVVGRDNQ